MQIEEAIGWVNQHSWRSLLHWCRRKQARGIPGNPQHNLLVDLALKMRKGDERTLAHIDAGNEDGELVFGDGSAHTWQWNDLAVDFLERFGQARYPDLAPDPFKPWMRDLRRYRKSALAVARFLRRQGVLGERKSEDACPIAVWSSRFFPGLTQVSAGEFAIEVETNINKEEVYGEVSLRGYLEGWSTFVCRFDEGKYPDLEREDA